MHALRKLPIIPDHAEASQIHGRIELLEVSAPTLDAQESMPLLDEPTTPTRTTPNSIPVYKPTIIDHGHQLDPTDIREPGSPSS